ncbi:GSCFA family protein [Gelidibacter algens]|uniref:GSCFA family protein n=1 Tax=Gelidibacter algens TaxID=49280 RepID=A0A1A7R4I3_9FLAO|nr:GSCFA domain-containing protein [Gelidibacter algens]OBX27165.1 GSCFA domain-containing protein [Gelidibacter algens]RAJ22017.1 GSCFA family protein [Gelidibacter algens]
MKLQTQIPLHKRTENLIDYRSKIFLLGSCFVENIGQKLAYFKFQSHQNPFGILFHPKAIETLVFRAIDDKKYVANDIFFHNEQWHCYDAHSQMSNSSKEMMLANLNMQLDLTKQQLKEASHVVLTLGTAWVYKHHTSNFAVANCHKVSQQNFKKELLSVKEITESLQTLMHKIKGVNAAATVIFTVSPIRHIKDGFVENTQSKAHLIAAIHALLANKSESGNFYFSSYELMMDELRDYRFYAEDMLHPNATAINYIWEKFQKVWMSEDALETMVEVDSIQKGMSHQAFNPNSEAHSKFLAQLQRRKETLHAKFKHMTF